MQCQVYIKDGMLYADFQEASMIFSELKYQVGEAAVDFSMLPTKTYRNMLSQLRGDFLVSMEKGESNEAFWETLKHYALSPNEMNPYYYFYIDNFIQLLLYLRYQDGDIPKLLWDYLLIQGEESKAGNISYDEMSQLTLSIAGMQIFDMQMRQSRLKEDFGMITSSEDIYTGLTPLQRLYILSKRGGNYLSGGFRGMLKPNYSQIPEESDLKKMKAYLLKHKIDIVEMVEIDGRLLLASDFPHEHMEVFDTRNYIIPQRYERPRTSGLEPIAVVAEGRNRFTFVLSSAPERK